MVCPDEDKGADRRHHVDRPKCRHDAHLRVPRRVPGQMDGPVVRCERRGRVRHRDPRDRALGYGAASMIPSGFQKARLEIDGGDSIECAFNPQSYTITKSNVWTYKPTQGSDLPAPEFGGGMPMTYKLALLLDTSLDGPDKSVKDDANKLMQAMHGNGSAPKFVTFTWGSVKLPKAAPMSISI